MPLTTIPVGEEKHVLYIEPTETHGSRWTEEP